MKVIQDEDRVTLEFEGRPTFLHVTHTTIEETVMIDGEIVKGLQKIEIYSIEGPGKELANE